MKRTSRWNGNLTFSAVILCLIGVLSWSDASLAQPPNETAPREASLNDSRSTATPPAEAVPAAESFAEAASSITDAALKRHIDFLASDTLQGREAGTQGNYAAGAYLVDQLRTSKLSTLSNDAEFFRYFHPNFRNIFAVIPGSDKKLQSEFILVGAHYDHVGFGNQTNSRGPFGVVHNGADDNASGTAGVLEIAKALAGLSVKPKRSILIAFWDGEEKGLLGSRHFADYPEIPLSQIRFHLNADMIGRLRPDGLEISGWQTATGCRQFLTQQNTAGLKLRFMYSYKPESDHWPFFERRVPSLMLHTGKHEDYHRPSDDTHLLNMEGIRAVSQFMLHCSIAAANAETLPGFRDWSEESSDAFTRLFANPRQNEPSRLGVTYNGTLAKEGTIQLMSVDSGSPANLAGLQVGDRVLALDNRPITRSSDFRSLVMTAPTETVFKVKRDEAELEIPATLRGNPVLLGFRWTINTAEPGSVIVTHVAPESPAAIATLKPQHRIRAVAGQSIENRDQFQKLLIEAPDPIRLEVERDGKVTTLSVKRLNFASDEPSQTASNESAMPTRNDGTKNKPDTSK